MEAIWHLGIRPNWLHEFQILCEHSFLMYIHTRQYQSNMYTDNSGIYSHITTKDFHTK